jgi:spore coat protein U-like protein
MKRFQLKKAMAVAVALGTLSLAGASHAAGSASGTFNVAITLTSACTLGAIGSVDFAYTSLQGGVANSAPASGGFTVTCTNTLPYSFGLQAGTAAAVPPGAASITPPADDVVGLIYTLNAPAASAGTGVGVTHNVTGTMAPGQAGICTGASCTNGTATNRTHTLILNF